MREQPNRPKRGAPWKHKLTIRELKSDFLHAEVSLVGESWVWITSLISFILAVGLFWLGWFSFSKSIGGAITSLVFGVLLLAFSIFMFACISYSARLIVDELEIRFSRCFFWKWKHDVLPLAGGEYIQCWNHSVGTGTGREDSFHVCLHSEKPIPVICLYSNDYVSRLKKGIQEKLALPQGSEVLIEDEALSEILGKADEIANNLKLEHKENSG